MSTCRPDLGTVDDVVIILAHGPSLKAGEIGSGAGFAVALTPLDFASGDFGEVFLFLGLVSEFKQNGSQHRCSEEADGRDMGSDSRHLFVQDAHLFLAEAASPIFRGPSRCRVATTRAGIEPNLSIGFAGLTRRLVFRRSERSWTVFVQPSSKFVSKIFSVFFFRHALILSVSMVSHSA